MAIPEQVANYTPMTIGMGMICILAEIFGFHFARFVNEKSFLFRF